MSVTEEPKDHAAHCKSVANAYRQAAAEADALADHQRADLHTARGVDRQAMLAEGFDGYQTKPITLKTFLAQIESVLATHN